MSSYLLPYPIRARRSRCDPVRLARYPSTRASKSTRLRAQIAEAIEIEGSCSTGPTVFWAGGFAVSPSHAARQISWIRTTNSGILGGRLRGSGYVSGPKSGEMGRTHVAMIPPPSPVFTFSNFHGNSNSLMIIYLFALGEPASGRQRATFLILEQFAP